ncbi:MAG: M13 family metallopeptidase [Rikenellaceae bacterium]|nr:M13 family metallopeptidase [Rikenellaceae bacterium]
MKRTLLIFAVALMTVSCGEKKTSAPAIDLTSLDKSISPKENFYQYATRGWQEKNPLKPEFARYGSFDKLRENNEIRINNLFKEMTAMQTAEGSTERKICDLYKLGLDSVRLNQEGADPVQQMLQEILTVEREGLTDLLATLHYGITNPLFAPFVEADMKNSDMNAFYLWQSGLGMGNRDYYIEQANAAIKEGYKAYLKKIFTLAGMEEAQAAKAQEATLAIEDQIAEISRASVVLRDMGANYFPMAYEELKAKYSAVDWEAYFKVLGMEAPATIIVGQPEVMEKVNQLLKSAPMEQLRYYLAAHYLNSAASSLSDDFYAASFDFFGRQMSGAQEPRPRWKRAMAATDATFDMAVGKMYVEKYFPEKDKEKMTQLVKNLQVALGQHIDALEWMSEETKGRAHEKLATFKVKIGYPDTWKQFDSLEIDPAKSYWENLVAASIWSTAEDFAKVGKPVDKEEWLMSPQTVNAYYNPTTNEICFPAAILQPPFYNSEADDAVNYGAIGVVIGHEMTHGFDDQGRNYDKDGNLNNWWTEADAAAFKERTDVLVKQFNAIEVLPAKGDQPALYADGELSLGENIADQGGLRVAYTALQNSYNGVTPAPIEGFTAAQRFYLAYSALWAQNIRDEEIARLTKLDVHSLGVNRVNATLKNIQSFYDAFDVQPGDGMYLAPEERVIIW